MIFCMTQKNTILSSFAFFSIFCIALSSFSFFWAIAKDYLILPPTSPRFPSFLSRIPFMPCNFVATVISCAILQIAVPISIIFVVRLFGKKLPSESVFFSAFLLGCLCESARLLTIALGIWQSFSDLLLIFGRILIFGRTLVTTSFLFAALMSESTQRQAVARNFLALLAIATIVAVVTPINTSLITSTATATAGFAKTFRILRFISVLLAILLFLYNAHSRERIAYKNLAIALIFLIIGYASLLCADNFVLLALGTALLAIGIPRYLFVVHELHVWK